MKKKWIRNTITLLGVISALIAIRGVFFKPMHIDLEIEVRSPVFWEDEPVSVSAETDVWTADMMDYKVVVFQRNTKDPSGNEIFQFEKLLTKRSDTLKGNIWFGSQEIGNHESYIVTAVVVKKFEKFKKYPFTYSLETIPFKAIAQKTVKRNDETAGKPKK